MLRTCLALLIAGGLLVGCEHADPLSFDVPDEEVVTLPQVQEAVFNTSCAVEGCHAGDFPPQGLDLSEGQAFANLVNVPSQEIRTLLRVAPNDPDNSYLFMKIIGASGIAGERMPFGRPPLSDEQIDLVRRWIEDGALEN